MLNRFLGKVAAVKKEFGPRSTEEMYMLSAKLAAINGVLLAWKENGLKESVEDIVNLLMGIIMKF